VRRVVGSIITHHTSIAHMHTHTTHTHAHTKTTTNKNQARRKKREEKGKQKADTGSKKKKKRKGSTYNEVPPIEREHEEEERKATQHAQGSDEEKKYAQPLAYRVNDIPYPNSFLFSKKDTKHPHPTPSSLPISVQCCGFPYEFQQDEQSFAFPL